MQGQAPEDITQQHGPGLAHTESPSTSRLVDELYNDGKGNAVDSLAGLNVIILVYLNKCC